MNARNPKFLIGAAVAAGAVVALVLILVSVLGNSSSGDKNAATTSTVRTQPTRPDGGTGTTAAPAKLPGAAETAALLKGIPQHLNVLGKSTAPVTMIEFADLQCPYCREYTVDAFPAIVDKYVRDGKVKLVFSGMHFIGPDSETALRAIYAAGLQGHFWDFLDLLYKSQGAENSGWVTNDLLESVGASIPGFDTKRMFADMQGPEVTAGLAAADGQAQKAGVNSTPTFFAGPTGQTLQHLNVTALTPDAFTPTLDQLTQ